MNAIQQSLFLTVQFVNYGQNFRLKHKLTLSTDCERNNSVDVHPDCRGSDVVRDSEWSDGK